MREIKFRGWCFKNERWEYGFYVNDVLYPDSRTSHRISPNNWEVDENSIGQYTGLKDKNGKEMFESDRIKANDVYGVYEGHIVWWEDRWALTYIGQDGVTPQFQSLMTVRNPEVIGNIFEK